MAILQLIQCRLGVLTGASLVCELLIGLLLSLVKLWIELLALALQLPQGGFRAS